MYICIYIYIYIYIIFIFKLNYIDLQWREKKKNKTLWFHRQDRDHYSDVHVT